MNTEIEGNQIAFNVPNKLELNKNEAHKLEPIKIDKEQIDRNLKMFQKTRKNIDGVVDRNMPRQSSLDTIFIKRQNTKSELSKMPTNEFVADLFTKKGMCGKITDVRNRKIREKMLQMKKKNETDEVNSILLKNGISLSEFKKCDDNKD